MDKRLEERTYLYPSGQLKKLEFYLDGEREGKCKEWFENGRFCSHEFYRAGKFEGERKEWYENGQPRVQEFYRNGKHEGERRMWNRETGQLINLEFYRNGKLEGERKTWYENGAARSYEFYRDGNKEGEQKFWYTNGQIHGRIFYRKEKCEGRLWHSNGLLSLQSGNWNLALDGEYRQLDEYGRLQHWEFWKKGDIVDRNFNSSKKNVFIRSVRCSQKRAIRPINGMIISDLEKIIARLI